jgi:hypothetical protein
VDVTDRVTVRDGSGVEGSVIATGAPAVVFLGHEVQGGAVRALCRAVWQHGANSVLAMARRSGARRRSRQVAGGPDVVLMWWKM